MASPIRQDIIGRDLVALLAFSNCAVPGPVYSDFHSSTLFWSATYHKWLIPASPISAGFWQGWSRGNKHSHEMGRETKRQRYSSPFHCLGSDLQKELHLLLGSSSFWIGPLRIQILLSEAGLWSWLLHILLLPLSAKQQWLPTMFICRLYYCPCLASQLFHYLYYKQVFATNMLFINAKICVCFPSWSLVYTVTVSYTFSSIGYSQRRVNSKFLIQVISSTITDSFPDEYFNWLVCRFKKITISRKFGIKLYTLLYLKLITNKDLLESTENYSMLCGSIGEERRGDWGENGYKYTFGWDPLLPTWIYHNIVNQLYSIVKLKC